MLDDLQEFLAPYRTTLDALFRHCCLTGRGAGQYDAEALSSMGPAQFRHLLRSCGLYEDEVGSMLGPSHP